MSTSCLIKCRRVAPRSVDELSQKCVDGLFWSNSHGENILGPPGFEPRTPAWQSTTLTMSLKRLLGMALSLHSSPFYFLRAGHQPQLSIARYRSQRPTQALPNYHCHQWSNSKGKIFWVRQDSNQELEDCVVRAETVNGFRKAVSPRD